MNIIISFILFISPVYANEIVFDDDEITQLITQKQFKNEEDPLGKFIEKQSSIKFDEAKSYKKKNNNDKTKSNNKDNDEAVEIEEYEIEEILPKETVLKTDYYKKAELMEFQFEDNKKTYSEHKMKPLHQSLNDFIYYSVAICLIMLIFLIADFIRNRKRIKKMEKRMKIIERASS